MGQVKRPACFLATKDVSADGSLPYVVNFNVHRDMVPSTVSVVATEPVLGQVMIWCTA